MGKILQSVHDIVSSSHAQSFYDRCAPAPLDRAREAAAHQAWNAMDGSTRAAAGGRTAYLASQGVIEPSPSARNTHRLREEAAKRMHAGFDRRILPLAATSSARSAIEILASLESVDLLSDLYTFQKKAAGSTQTKNSGLNNDVRVSVRNCLRQGRELFLTGLGGGLLAKPLSHFYAVTAYAYATAVMCNPNHHSLDSLPGSHGVTHLKDDFAVEFGGNSPRGTFSELHGGLTTNYIPHGRTGFAVDCTESIFAFHESKITTGLRTLLALVPEIRQFFELATGEKSRTHPVRINSEVGEIEFEIGDGEYGPNVQTLASAFPGITAHSRSGRSVLRVRHREIDAVRACFYVDVAGSIWFIDSPFGALLLPEMCLHFLILSSLSTIMRYAPRLWGEVLLNEIDSAEALLLRQYFIAFEDKFPILMLRVLSKYFPLTATPSAPVYHL